MKVYLTKKKKKKKKKEITQESNTDKTLPPLRFPDRAKGKEKGVGQRVGEESETGGRRE